MHSLGRCSLLLLIIVSASCGKVESAADDAGGIDANPDIDGGETDAGTQCPPGLICDLNVNFAFTSSTEITPSDLGGIAAGDTLCNTLAGDANLPGTYIAWLSTEGGDVRDRLGNASGWIRPDRRPFALNRAALLSSQIIHPISLDENGQSVQGEAVTATRADGSSDGETCQDWTSAGGVLFGIPKSIGEKWTAQLKQEPSSCEDDHHLYCLGVDFNAPLTMPAPASGRLAWVSTSPLNGNDGVIVMDSVCQTEASEFGMSSAKAFVSTTSEAASDRFDVSGPTWVRSDGVILWEEANDIRTKSALAPIVLSIDGSPLLDSAIWTGSVDLRTRANTNGQDNCNDWATTASGQGIVGNSSRNGSEFFSTKKVACSQSLPFYCLEE